MPTKAIVRAADEARLAALRAYLAACVKQNILSPDDLRNPLALLAKLGSTMLSDLRVVCSDALKSVGAVASMKAAEGFFELAANMAQKKK